jgi:hypothetical protein
MKRLLLLAIVCAGCSSRRAPEIQDVDPPRPTLASGTQADLARELDDAERHGTWLEVRRRWQGQRLRWTVTRQRVLCATPTACNVAAFPIQRPAQQGWLPALALSPDEFAKLERGCGHAEQCEVELEGTLDLVLSPELPTSLKFADVSILRAQAG